MQKKEKINRSRKVTVRFTDTEYSKVEISFKTTTKRKLSEYIRYVLLDKPVTVYTRNQSMDEVVAVLFLLKGELSAIGNNFNQVVKRLHTMDRIPEIKAWAEAHEKSYSIFMQKADEINSKIHEIANQWLQE